MNDQVPPRYIAKGREVWDSAWSNPFTGFVTSGVDRNRIVVTYPSVAAAYEAAESLNEYAAKPIEERLEQFNEDAAAALRGEPEADYRARIVGPRTQYALDRELANEQVNAKLRPDWLDFVTDLDTL